MASDVAVEHRLSAWNPDAEEIAAILIEMRPIVRAFAERDASVHPATSIAGSDLRLRTMPR